MFVGCDPTTPSKPEGFSLTILSSDADAGRIDGELHQTLRKNEPSSIVKAVPNLGYKFVKWSNNSFDDELSISIFEDTVIFALFTKDYLELPVMEINTKDRKPIIFKETYLQRIISAL